MGCATSRRSDAHPGLAGPRAVVSAPLDQAAGKRKLGQAPRQQTRIPTEDTLSLGEDAPSDPEAAADLMDVDVRMAALETVDRRRLTVLRQQSDTSGAPSSTTSSMRGTRLDPCAMEDPSRGVGNGAFGENGAYARMQLSFSCLSRPGNDPAQRQKENQDAFVVRCGLGRDADCFAAAVFDGHGPQGARASAFVRDRLLDACDGLGLGRRACRGEEEVRRVLHEACVDVNRRLAGSSVDAYVSGSTGVLAVLKRDVLFVANVGDSRAVLARRGEGGALRAVDLSEDHKPDRPDERARILRAGGRVFEWGVPRVWRGDADMPGLAMARSFGDLAAEAVGVFAEPEVTRTRLRAGRDDFLIVATDGVWEFLSSQQVADVLAAHAQSKSPEQAARDASAEVVRLSVARWNEEEDVVDDCTCVIVALPRED